MKIAFICGKFAPGLCGVGDYTRRLAAQVARLGHECVVIAINDPHVSSMVGEIQMEEATTVRCHRFPQSLGWRSKSEQLFRLLEQECPDVLNIQFVSYAFHRKGIPLRFYLLLREMRAVFDLRVSIMFHELWLGASGSVSLSKKVTGIVQRHFCLLIAKLCDQAVFTNTRLHQRLLGKYGIHAEYIPLFGNIPMQSIHLDLHEEIETFIAGRSLVLHFGTFASMEQSSLGEVLPQIRAVSGNNALPLVFIACGAGGAFEAENKRAAEQALGPSNVRFIGRVDAETLSELMKRATYGLSRSRPHNWEKSGVVAAMQEHGLPVISYAKQSLGERVGAEQPATVGTVARMFVDAIEDKKP